MRLFAVTVSSPGGSCTEPPTSRIFFRPEKTPYSDSRTRVPTLMGEGKRSPLSRAHTVQAGSQNRAGGPAAYGGGWAGVGSAKDLRT